jgi:hypothetical protein
MASDMKAKTPVLFHITPPRIGELRDAVSIK